MTEHRRNRFPEVWIEKLDDNYDEKERKRERARSYSISVAELNQMIVREFKTTTAGLSLDDVVKRFSDYSLQQIKDALESTIEDEYFKVKTKDNGTLWYTPIIYDEYDL